MLLCRSAVLGQNIWGAGPSPSLPYPPVTSPPFSFPFHFAPLPLSSLFLLEVGPLNTAKGSRERCKLPQRGLGRSPSGNRKLSHALCAPGQHTAESEESARDNYVLAYIFAKYSPILPFFSLTDRLTNKPFLIWLLTTPPHLKHAATLPCNSLRACFADVNVSQGSVAIYTRCVGMFNIHLTANLTRNPPVKKIMKSVKISPMSVWPRFLAHPVYLTST